MSSPKDIRWFAVSRLIGLPGIPETHAGILRRAATEGWVSRKRKARGGGSEYALTSLPVETQAALLNEVSRKSLADSAEELLRLADEHRAMATRLRRFAKAIEGKSGGRS